ncbi:transcriptional regulator [Amycolatopsis sp. AA4]|uniref:ArsR/SmtB family transcription factor n=1 Tax=Amycolatopsis sp. AA4 TaxID=1896961 RepID=UPI0001DEE57C|nr:metalloregulator ArsR/SmtB family transcription factor [Amycolatopsis sp. AA4]ATY12667.1 transcriptional regulator [Amycolatopsis sp. AA4]EFL08470.1 ArsR family transcriptional regulator [Streptomyces sp. AA4]
MSFVSTPSQPPLEPLPADLLQDAAATFGLLSATVRLHLLWLLSHGERDVGTLAEETGQTVPTASHHLGKLKLAGLVRARREGKRQVYVLDDPHVRHIVQLAVQHHQELSGDVRRSKGA